ncbi:FliH/SctL family protein [Methylophilus sp. Leaf408]|uniref:FliH/SctL family protein n=1 Tax=Methylophilus sp. Leaf408 TaxID=2876561 RepID=UPI001E5A6B8C|nr:FliH/SctL family protein [Methylophilus sp. Leaf408]
MSEFLIPILHQLPPVEVPVTPAIDAIFSPAQVAPDTSLSASVASVPLHDKTLMPAEAPQPENSEKLLSEIEALKTLAYEKAYAEGLTQGKEDGLKRVSADMKQSLGLLKEVEETFKEQCQQYIADLDTVIAAIVFEAVLKIVGSEIKQPVNRAEIIQQVIAQYDGHHMLQILVNPADIKTLKQTLQHSDAEQATLQALVYPDSKVAVGGCRIVFKEGIVNTDIHKQLQAFAVHLSQHTLGQSS